MTSSDTPRRGEVWIVNFDPTIGTEIRKIRPAVVISSNNIGVLPIKLFAAILNTSLSTVQKWGIGQKRPTGTALKLLCLIQKGGLDRVL